MNIGRLPKDETRLRPGSVIAPRELATIAGHPLCLPDAKRLVHLQVRRFAGCPICHLHLRSFVKRSKEIDGAGIAEVVVFHSSRQALMRYAGDLPFAVVADPLRRLYVEFGVEAAPRALLHPRAWWPILRAVAHSLWSILRERRAVPPMVPQGGRFGLPADFLIGRDGRVWACKYGSHADDQWSVDELLALASAEHEAPTSLAPEPGGPPELHQV
jgi:peroxiredoxin